MCAARGVKGRKPELCVLPNLDDRGVSPRSEWGLGTSKDSNNMVDLYVFLVVK